MQVEIEDALQSSLVVVSPTTSPACPAAAAVAGWSTLSLFLFRLSPNRAVIFFPCFLVGPEPERDSALPGTRAVHPLAWASRLDLSAYHILARGSGRVECRSRETYYVRMLCHVLRQGPYPSVAPSVRV